MQNGRFITMLDNFSYPLQWYFIGRGLLGCVPDHNWFACWIIIGVRAGSQLICVPDHNWCACQITIDMHAGSQLMCMADYNKRINKRGLHRKSNNFKISNILTENQKM